MILRYTEMGFLIMLPEDDLDEIVDAMLETGYDKEFCVSPSFDPGFVAGLMEAGFLVMSARLGGESEDGANDDGDSGRDENAPANEIFYICIPKLHLVRSALFFENLHVKKSIRRHLGQYELRPDSDFDLILDRCVETHGDDWLTPPLVGAIRGIRQQKIRGAYPMSFALYHNDKLVAGEFGVKVGNVYTSYSGYYEESNSGTAQLILTTRYLQENGFAFFDLGMPLDYKNDLGALDISPEEFVRLFRLARN